MGKLTVLIIAIFLILPSSLWGELVGSYATYKWTSKVEVKKDVLYKTVTPDGKASYKIVKEMAKAKPIYLTYSVLKATDKDYLLQVVTQEGKDTEPLSISQVLIDRKTGKGLKAVIKSPKDIAVSFSPGNELIHIPEKSVKEGKRVKLTVPAGTYSCLEGTFNGQQVCVSNEIPSLGIVKANLEDGTVELIESSPTGAKDLIKKTKK